MSHLERLGAAARPAASAAADDARMYCATVLRGAGFVVSEHSFKYSEFAGAVATPVAGVLAALTGIGLYLGRHWPLLSVGSAAALVIVSIALAYVGRAGVLDLPVRRRGGVNLQATRSSDEPTVWLVAHIDSKWQPVSMMARVGGVVATTGGLFGLLALNLFHGQEALAATLLVVTWLGATPLILSIVGHRNHGTLDNASGVAAVLEAAEMIPAGARVGVLITDAEEMGLAGARAWTRGRAPAVALNCDSVDDDGRVTVMHGTPVPHALIARVRRAASDQEEPVRVIRLIPGILTDHVALAAAGWQTVTLSRGNLRTLGRVHTSRDTLDFMRGTGIASMARILARSATELG